jgi:hypothetical protein
MKKVGLVGPLVDGRVQGLAPIPIEGGEVYLGQCPEVRAGPQGELPVFVDDLGFHVREGVSIILDADKDHGSERTVLASPAEEVVETLIHHDALPVYEGRPLEGVTRRVLGEAAWPAGVQVSSGGGRRLEGTGVVSPDGGRVCPSL